MNWIARSSKIFVQVTRLDAHGRSLGTECTVIQISYPHYFLRTESGRIVRSLSSRICATKEDRNHSTRLKLDSAMDHSASPSNAPHDATGHTRLSIGDQVLPLGFNLETGASATVQDIHRLTTGAWEIGIITEDNTVLHVQPRGVLKCGANAKVSGISFPLLPLLFPCGGVLIDVMKRDISHCIFHCFSCQRASGGLRVRRLYCGHSTLKGKFLACGGSSLSRVTPRSLVS